MTDEEFNEGDYLLFYGKGPGDWEYHAGDQMFLYTKHLYSDAAFYFITSDVGTGKEIDLMEQSAQDETDTISSFDDYEVHEENVVNLIKSGREWFEPVLNYGENHFNFNFPNRFKLI